MARGGLASRSRVSRIALDALTRSSQPPGHRLGHAHPDPVDGHRPVGPRRGDALQARHAGHRGHPAVVVDDQAGAGQPGQQRRGHVAQRLQPALVLAPQAGLGQLHRGADQRDRGRVHGLGRAADVDHAEQVAGARVVHGARGAGPHVVAAHEVLGGEHLHRGALGQRGADGVAADRCRSDQLAPSVKPSASARRRTAVEPSRQSSTPSASVTTMMCRASSATEVSAARSSGSTRCSGEPIRRCSTSSAVTGPGGSVRVGVDALGAGPQPGAGHQPARVGGRAVTGEQGVVHPGEHAGVPADVDARPDRADSLVHGSPPASPGPA